MSTEAPNPIRAVEAIDSATPWTQRLQLLLESTGEGIFGVDTAGCCTIGKRIEDRPPLHTKCNGIGRLIATAVDNVGRIIDRPAPEHP